jgi:hypothetical protein
MHALTLTAISITAPALFYLPTSISVAGFFHTTSLLHELLFFYRNLKHALTLTAIHGFFHTASMLNDLLFAYSRIK